MKLKKITYQFVLAIFSITILGVVANTILNYESVALDYLKLGYPVYLIHLLGFAQITGLILLITKQDKKVKDWVYAGFFINFTMAAIAHMAVKDGNGASAVVCLILLWVTYLQYRQIQKMSKQKTTLEVVHI